MVAKKSAGDWIGRMVIFLVVVSGGVWAIAAIAGSGSTQPLVSPRPTVASSANSLAPYSPVTPITSPGVVPIISSAPTTTTTTTLVCPTGAPRGTDTSTVTPDPTVSGFWDVTVNGTVTNDASAPVLIDGASAQLRGGNGSSLFPMDLIPQGGQTTLQPGQSVAVSSGAPDGPIDSLGGPPTAGGLAVTWAWTVDSGYIGSCPMDYQG